MNAKQAYALLSATTGALALAAVLVVFSVWGVGSPVVRADAADGYDTYHVAPACGGIPAPCYTTVQAAVDAVDEATDLVKIATGRYTGVSVRQGVAQVVYVSKTVTLQGGYAMFFTGPPDPAAEPTTLDAEGNGRVFYIAGGVTATIRGLRLTGGDADGLGGGRWAGEDAGGGIYGAGASLIISDCAVFSNTARSGGGLFLQDAVATLTGNSITSNTATTNESGSYGDGGGLLVLSSTVTMTRNLVRSNNAGFSGSGLYAESDSDARLTNNVVADNVVDTDAYSFDCAIYVGASYLEMVHNTIARNLGGGGTGICVDTSTATSTAMCTNTVIADHLTGIDVAADSQTALWRTLWQGNATDSLGNVTRIDDCAGALAFAADGYHLTAQSAAIDQGVETGLNSDIDRQQRPRGVAPDIGADEWQTDHYVDLAGKCHGFTPCHTSIGSAVGSARGGDTIHVFPGTYPESVNLSTMGSPGDIKLLTVDATGTPTPGTATVDPGAPGGPGTGQAFRHSVVPFPGNVTIDGFNVNSPKADGIRLRVSSDIAIANVTANAVGDGNDVDGTGDDGLDLWAETGNITITRCSVTGSFGRLGDGVDVQMAAGNVSIIGCSGSDNRGTDDNQGFEIEDLGGNLLISDTVAENNSDEGFLISNIGGQVTIYNCRGDLNGDGGMEVDAQGDVTVDGFTADSNIEDGLDIDTDGTVTVKNCVSTLSAGQNAEGFYLESDQEDVKVTDSVANGNGSDGFEIIVPNGDVTIEGCTANDNVDSAGFDLDPPGGPLGGSVVIGDSTANGNAEEGFLVTAQGHVTVTNVSADQNGDGGMEVDADGHVTAEGFTANGNTEDGLDLDADGYVTVVDCTSTDNAGQEAEGYYLESGEGVTVVDSVGSGNGSDGFVILADGDVSVDSCTADYNVGSDGFDIGPVGGSVAVTACTATGNADDGLDIWDINGDVTIDGAVSEENGENGLWLEDSGDVTLRASLAQNNGGDGFAMEWTDAVTVATSMAYSNTWDGFWIENASGDLMVLESASRWNEEDGFYGRTDGDVTVRGFAALDNGWDGFWIDYAAGYVDVLDGDARDNEGEGVYVNADGKITVTHSTADRNDRLGEPSSGFVLLSDDDLVIQSCTASANSDDGFSIYIGGQLTISDCVAQDNVGEGVYVGTLGIGSHQVGGNVFCENGLNGLSLNTARTVNAEGNWWGDVSGADHPTNPGGTGDGVQDGQNGGAGTVDFTPWIDTIAGEASVDPVIAGQPTVVSFGISGQAGTLTLGPGPGDPNGPAPFTVMTDNGILADADETGPEVHMFIGEPGGMLTVTLVPTLAGTATVTLDGPCSLDAATAVGVLPCNEPASVTITAPPTVTVGREAVFTATVSPVDAHLPITFTWEVTGQAEQIRVRTGISDTRAYTWFVVGRQTLTVTAVSLCGSAGAGIPITVTNLAPVAEAGPNQAVLVDETVTLDGSGSYDPDGHVPLDYRWAQAGGPSVVLDDGIAVSTTFPAPSTPAVLTFTLIVTDAYGLPSSPDETVVAVCDSPIVGLEAANSSPTTLGQRTSLTASVASGANVAYTWAFGDGDVGAGQTTSHTYGSAAVYTAVVTATNAVFEVSATTLVTITNLAPVAVAGQDQGVLAGEAVVLDGSGSCDPDGHDPLAYGWTQTGGPLVTLYHAASVSATLTAPDAPMVLSFTLTVTDAYGLASLPDTTVVTVRDVPITGLDAKNSSPTTLGQLTLFSATVATGGNVTYQWGLGDGHTGAGRHCSHVYGAAGLYTAIVTASNGAGPMSTTTLVTVTNQAPVASAGPDQEVLTGAGVTLDGGSSQDPDGHLPLSYGWMQLGGPPVALEDSAAVSTTFIAPPVPTVLSFTLTVTDAYGLVSVPDACAVTVGDVPISGLQAANSSPTPLGQPTLFTATVMEGGNVSYLWAFDDGGAGVGRIVSHTYAAAGIYTAVVTASNAAGQVSAATLVEVEEGASPVFLPLVLRATPGAIGRHGALFEGGSAPSQVVRPSRRQRF